MLVFYNPGSIDPRLIKSFGVCVKENESAIGYFGTGLKYAIAVTLRLGGSVKIKSLDKTYVFGVKEETIRGKTFKFVAMDGEPLAFTLDLGKNWEPWMAYREFYCNALDEHGGVEAVATMPLPGMTEVIVDCRELDDVHRERSRYFITDPPIWENSKLSVHTGATHLVFNKGIAIGKVAQACAFRYNLKSHVDLTEDRTARYSWSLQSDIGKSLLACTDKKLIKQIITASPDSYEGSMDFYWASIIPSDEFLDVVAELVASNIRNVLPSAVKAYEYHRNIKAQIALFTPNAIEQQQFAKATAMCDLLGYKMHNLPIKFAESLSENVFGMVRDDEIYIARHAFHTGTKQLAVTLIEEYLHLKCKLDDYSRALQDRLLFDIVSLGERLRGECL